MCTNTRPTRAFFVCLAFYQFCQHDVHAWTHIDFTGQVAGFMVLYAKELISPSRVKSQERNGGKVFSKYP